MRVPKALPSIHPEKEEHPMQRSAKFVPLIFLLSTALVASCVGETTESELIVKNTVEDLPNCSNGKFAAVYYVVSTDEFYFCDGSEFILVDLSGQDGSSCTVSEDSAGNATITCEDGTVATVSDGQDGQDGQNGQDGQDGTSCTVTRDDAAGTTTISCEDGTVAVVEDGQDGQDGTSCTIAETAAGAAITCGADTVTITDGQDGSSCSASTDASGAITISCDDGTSATIPAGDGGDAVALVCGLLLNNPSLVPPDGLECPPACGDGVVDPGEECDPPDGVTCNASCQSLGATLNADVNLVGTLTCTALLIELQQNASLLFEVIDNNLTLIEGVVDFVGICGQVVESLEVIVSVDGATPTTLSAVAPGVPVVLDQPDPVVEAICAASIPLDFTPMAVSSVTSPTVDFQITDIASSGVGDGVAVPNPFAWGVENPDCTLTNNNTATVSAQ
jgi:hypothetical protein